MWMRRPWRRRFGSGVERVVAHVGVTAVAALSAACFAVDSRPATFEAARALRFVQKQLKKQPSSQLCSSNLIEIEAAALTLIQTASPRQILRHYDQRVAGKLRVIELEVIARTRVVNSPVPIVSVRVQFDSNRCNMHFAVGHGDI